MMLSKEDARTGLPGLEKEALVDLIYDQAERAIVLDSEKTSLQNRGVKESMTVTLVPAEDYEYVQTLFQYYIYDMSEYTGWPPDDNGSYGVSDSLTGLSDYWAKPNHFPYLIKVGADVAGFSLIRKYPGDDECFDMGQFFVLRKFKRTGIGEQAFRLSVSKHPGKWIIRVLPNNIGAKKFWLKVIKSVANTEVVKKTELYKTTEMEFIRFSA